MNYEPEYSKQNQQQSSYSNRIRNGIANIYQEPKVKRITPIQMREELNKRSNKDLVMSKRLLNKYYASIRDFGIKLQKRFCIVKIPLTELDVMRCDKNRILLYVYNDLTANGFKVQFVDPNYLIIRWNLAVNDHNTPIEYIPSSESVNNKRQLTYNNTSASSFRDINDFQPAFPITAKNDNDNNNYTDRYYPSNQSVNKTRDVNPYSKLSSLSNYRKITLPENRNNMPLLF